MTYLLERSRANISELQTFEYLYYKLLLLYFIIIIIIIII
jgi:hypothetical protein